MTLQPLLTRDDAGAVIDPTGMYRYLLWRTWDTSLPPLAFIMLNPSTADENADDPTLRRCLGFARVWGYGRLSVVNLFAYRSTDPSALRTAVDPIGPENNAHITVAAVGASLVIAAWGDGGRLGGRDGDVLRRLGGPVQCLGVTAHGNPRHPLYVSYSTPPLPLAVTP